MQRCRAEPLLVVLLVLQFLLLFCQHEMSLTRGHLVVEWTPRCYRRVRLPQIQAACIAGNNAQPVAKALRSGEAVHMLKRLEKGVLGQVLGEGKVAQQTHTYPVHHLLIPLNECIEGSGITLQGASDQFRVAGVHHKARAASAPFVVLASVLSESMTAVDIAHLPCGVSWPPGTGGASRR